MDENSEWLIFGAKGFEERGMKVWDVDKGG